jgi:hypothetical protein
MAAAVTFNEILTLYREYIDLEERSFNVQRTQHDGLSAIWREYSTCKGSQANKPSLTLKELARILSHYYVETKAKKQSTLVCLSAAVELYLTGDYDVGKSIKRARVLVERWAAERALEAGLDHVPDEPETASA